MTADPAPVPEPVAPPLLAPPLMTTPQGARYLVVLGVVAGWMTLGGMFHLKPNDYLLLGVPLLALFQLGIARRPISELWIRPAAPAPFVWWSVPVAIVFMIAPGLALVDRWAVGGWSGRLWYFCAIAGAVPLAFTLTRFSWKVLKSLLLCFATAGVLGVMLLVGTAFLRHRLDDLSLAQLCRGGRQFLLYLPVCFILEEVFFRGGLDSYLHRPGDRLPWLSAAFVSVLWGLWHLPISPAHTVLQVLVLAIMYPIFHCLPGIPFSFFWRSSGSLLVPAAVHAFIDSVRNALFF
jgi:membrane protease YdiL (CAAX protease family)